VRFASFGDRGEWSESIDGVKLAPLVQCIRLRCSAWDNSHCERPGQLADLTGNIETYVVTA